MKKKTTTLILTALTIAMISSAETAQPVAEILTPTPNTIRNGKGTLVLTDRTTISLGKGTKLVGMHFADRLRNGSGWKIPTQKKGTIQLEIVSYKGSDETYELKITEKGIKLRAASAQGIVRGTDTLLQLMPPSIYGEGQHESISLPCLTIQDQPAYAWRGLMLDVSRHFQNKDTVIKLLDGMAVCKFNVFHWHLTDDQGWRLPIEGYPKLTADPTKSYSREDIRDVVEHAEKLGITIMPEIDMPGHSGASCRAYPEIGTLNSKGKMTGTMNPGADATYAFIEAVMKDVVKQFPNSPNIHIGADEVGTGNWKIDPQCQALMKRENIKNAHELKYYFINRVTAIVKKHDRKPFAWNEALSTKVDPDLTIMSWQGMRPGIDATQADRNVVFCPTPQIYFDHPNTRSKENPPAYSANASYLNHCYFFNPGLNAVAKDKRDLVLGGEACLWSERIKSADHMFIMMFPRAWAIGETLWTTHAQKDWDSFIARTEIQRKRFEAMNIPYFWEPESLAINIGSWKPGDIAAKDGVLEFPLNDKLTHAGLQEFFVGQGVGEGQFVIEGMEMLSDGEVVDQDWHKYESSVYRDAKSLFLLKTPDLTAKYTLRIHVKLLFGDCAATVQLNPALAPDQYSKQCGPETGSNRTKQDKTVE